MPDGLDILERARHVDHVGAVEDHGQNGMLIRDAVIGETKEGPAELMLREMLVPVPRCDA